jgi:hypothetical protein
MSLPTLIPRYSAKNIRWKADEFLIRHHPTFSLPVPIEEIIEFEFYINIVPLHGLHKAFEIDGFISHDLTAISVDAFVQESRPGRYRFTLAHEMGHVVLHREFFRQYVFKNVDEWKKLTQALSPLDYGTIEWQAYQFAGLILVPPKVLRIQYYEATKMAREKGVWKGKQAAPMVRQYLANWLAKQFVVSTEVIERCLQRDKL